MLLHEVAKIEYLLPKWLEWLWPKLQWVAQVVPHRPVKEVDLHVVHLRLLPKVALHRLIFLDAIVMLHLGSICNNSK